MGEVLLWSTFLVRVLQIDPVAGGEVLRDYYHRVGCAEKPGKRVFGLFALPHLCRELGIKEDDRRLASGYGESESGKPGGIG